MIRAAALTLLVAIGMSLASTGDAQLIDQTFTYQGELVDNGQPANGVYDIRFELFDAETGGQSVSFPITSDNLGVVEGYFETELLFPFSPLAGDELWVEVSVKPGLPPVAFTTLGRVKLNATPYASFSLRSDFADRSGTSLNDAYTFGRTIDAITGAVSIINRSGSGDTALELGAVDSRPPKLSLFDTDGVEVVEAASDSDGGFVRGRDDTGQITWRLGGDLSTGGGGVLTLNRRTTGSPASALGVEIEGNFAGTEKPRLFMGGGASDPFLLFSIDQTGDSAVRFPPDAINATEMLNEPGTASRIETILPPLLNAAGNVELVSRSIMCPTDGYILVVATTQLTLDHLALFNRPRSNIDFTLSVTGPVPAGGAAEVSVTLPNELPAGDYRVPVTLHRTFPVGAGLNTVRLSAFVTTNDFLVDPEHAEVSVLFVPTAYGAVGNARPGSGAAGLASEQRHAQHMNAERLQAELDAMRADLENLKREMATEHSTGGTR